MGRLFLYQTTSSTLSSGRLEPTSHLICAELLTSTRKMSPSAGREQRSHISYEVNKPQSYYIKLLISKSLQTNFVCRVVCFEATAQFAAPCHDIMATVVSLLKLQALCKAKALGQALKYRSSGRQYKIKCKTTAKTGREKSTGKQN